MISLLTQFSGNLLWDTCECNETCDDRGNILRWKLKRSFLRNFLVMCKFMSPSNTYVSWNSPLTLFLRNLRRDTLVRIEAYAGKGNIISSKSEGSFRRNFSVLCEFISQSYNLDLREQVASTLRGIWKVIFGWLLGSIVKKEISSDNNKGEAFWEIAFWCVTSSHRVPSFPFWNSLLTPLSWILQSDIWWLIEDYGEKGNIFT